LTWAVFVNLAYAGGNAGTLQDLRFVQTERAWMFNGRPAASAFTLSWNKTDEESRKSDLGCAGNAHLRVIGFFGSAGAGRPPLGESSNRSRREKKATDQTKDCREEEEHPGTRAGLPADREARTKTATSVGRGTDERGAQFGPQPGTGQSASARAGEASQLRAREAALRNASVSNINNDRTSGEDPRFVE
jgi:hypothetical protein